MRSPRPSERAVSAREGVPDGNVATIALRTVSAIASAPGAWASRERDWASKNASMWGSALGTLRSSTPVSTTSSLRGADQRRAPPKNCR